MKLTDENFDQAGFDHKRTIASLLFMRWTKFSASDRDVSYRDLAQLHAEHCHDGLVTKLKHVYIQLHQRLQNKFSKS